MNNNLLIMAILISLIAFGRCQSEDENKISSRLYEQKMDFLKKLESNLNGSNDNPTSTSRPNIKGKKINQTWKWIRTGELKKLMDSGKKDFILIDARNFMEYRDGHIKDSISIPAKDIPQVLPEKVADKDTRLIFYCNGPKCSKSKKAAKKAYSVNYTNLWVYNEGIPEWRKRRYAIIGEQFSKVDIPRISAKDLEKMKENKDEYFIIDIRDSDEFKKDPIKGTDMNAPLDKIESMFSEIPKNKKIVIFDRVGKQTPLGGGLLWREGFNDIYQLEGGWKDGWLKRKK